MRDVFLAIHNFIELKSLVNNAKIRSSLKFLHIGSYFLTNLKWFLLLLICLLFSIPLRTSHLYEDIIIESERLQILGLCSASWVRIFIMQHLMQSHLKYFPFVTMGHQEHISPGSLVPYSLLIPHPHPHPHTPSPKS